MIKKLDIDWLSKVSIIYKRKKCKYIVSKYTLRNTPTLSENLFFPPISPGWKQALFSSLFHKLFFHMMSNDDVEMI